ncbi:SGNH/GDSL hydrolase family protein [Streptomyces fulvorobeus]|uniref:Lysophospholipase L1-like esterase n=1 Tax=Streptomyces fulvorobeus TaxID=284028 RepID=A0A7J0C4D4_9ACTN|nr:SGNH/GDSL hydrolase family protein [Streptomyces fulvorobeus]NYE41042.1 lysophospholipase L1-like esterase [Streptomyces fulvorobeus]GFM97372.1 SGNH hydrolase [Streptomyces fulvorobeus]
MPRRRSYALLIALAAGTAVLAAVIAFGTTLLTGARPGLRPGPEPHAAARPPAAPANSAGTWVATWTAAAVGAEPGTARGLPGRTIRNTVHTSVAGDAARITLSNLFGTAPLVVDRATVNTRPVTFRGARLVSVPAGEQVVSDPVVVPVASDADLIVSFRTPRASGPVTFHPNSHQTSYVADDRGTWRTTDWRYLTAVDVRNKTTPGTIVVLGDSLAAGSGSTTDANNRWPDLLSDRLRGRYGVVNQGIAGNRLLADGPNPLTGPNGTSRFARDVLSVAGARTVVIALGINDVQQAPQEPDPQRILSGLRSLTAQAHARGLRVVGATLTPYQGYPTWTPERNAVRLAVNEQIRAGTVFDAYVDFDRAVRDPYAKDRILAAYDSGDRLHLNDDGYRALAELIDLQQLVDTPKSDEL